MADELPDLQNLPGDLQQLTIAELEALAGKIRGYMLRTVSRCGDIWRII